MTANRFVFTALRALNLMPVALLGMLSGCYYPYPTPKPIVTGGASSKPSPVERATYETSITSAKPVMEPALMSAPQPLGPIVRPYEQWTEQEAAADALGRIGTQAIPYLQQALKSPDPHVKKQAAEVLARMGSDARPAVNDLIPLLDDPDLEIRKVAARTLGRIGPDAAPAVPALMRTLMQQEPLPPAPLPLNGRGAEPIPAPFAPAP